MTQNEIIKQLKRLRQEIDKLIQKIDPPGGATTQDDDDDSSNPGGPPPPPPGPPPHP